jgi:hypothetical protein
MKVYPIDATFWYQHPMKLPFIFVQDVVVKLFFYVELSLFVIGENSPT